MKCQVASSLIVLAGVGKARDFVMLLTAAIVLAGVACLAV